MDRLKGINGEMGPMDELQRGRSLHRCKCPSPAPEALSGPSIDRPSRIASCPPPMPSFPSAKIARIADSSPQGRGCPFHIPQCPFIQSSAIVGHLAVILPAFVLFFPFRSINLASVHFPLHFHWPFPPLPSFILNKLLRNCRCISFIHIDQRGKRP